MTKTPLTQGDKKFNLKFLLVSDSGCGKTHLCGTYTLGPVHFYMLDPGGEKTLYKLLAGRPADCPITYDSFSMQKDTFSAFLKRVELDEREGFFDEMASKNGLVVMPDSLSAANDMALNEVAKRNQRTLLDQTKPMRIQDWGQLGAWMKNLIGFANDLPCAVAVTAHLQVEKDENGSVIARYPLISGNFRYSMGRMFDEVYLLETVGTKRRIVMTEKQMFNAKSRFFACKQLTDASMDQLAKAYMTGDDLASSN